MARDVPHTELELLEQLGVGDDEIAAAAAEGPEAVTLLAAGHLALPGPREYTARQVWEKAGVSEIDARRHWLAMGFPQVPDDVRAFTERDVEALALAVSLIERAHIDRDVALQQTRVMSQAVARIAGAQQDVVAEWAGLDETGELPTVARLAGEVLPALDRLIVYLYRRHLAAATERNALIRAPAHEHGSLTVGFADLVGFTELSQQIDERELAAIVDEFSAVAADIVVEGGGQVIKMIGDEVMFATPEPVQAATIALDLIDHFPGSDVQPALRGGLSCGPVLTREGDLFGPTVNRASRLVGIARPASVLADEDVSAAIRDAGPFDVKSIRPRKLKGLGTTRMHVVRRHTVLP